jgi:hypothetical protein
MAGLLAIVYINSPKSRKTVLLNYDKKQTSSINFPSMTNGVDKGESICIGSR